MTVSLVRNGSNPWRTSRNGRGKLWVELEFRGREAARHEIIVAPFRRSSSHISCSFFRDEDSGLVDPHLRGSSAFTLSVVYLLMIIRPLLHPISGTKGRPTDLVSSNKDQGTASPSLDSIARPLSPAPSHSHCTSPLHFVSVTLRSSVPISLRVFNGV